ncbi:uncharacterized protein MKZ38_010150 [Zalerion maritima]|uniref:Uncharacterized protein n=1 Tax=Zalerion maritima TaxID=339359 RepID=A0AAD5RTR4_9PEZI|nr:uncharacterized protein MKZ38_010150 [Zalerion maritima]
MLVSNLLHLAILAGSSASALPGVIIGDGDNSIDLIPVGTTVSIDWYNYNATIPSILDPSAAPMKGLFAPGMAKSGCEHDKNKGYCWDDGTTEVFCCYGGGTWDCIRKHYPAQIPTCAEDQYYSHKEGRCVCKDYLPPCNDDKGEEPYCTAEPDKTCPYDQDDERCEDNGKHSTFCSQPDPPKVEEECKKKWGY